LPSWIVTEQPVPQAHVREATEADLPRLIELIAQLSLAEPVDDARRPLDEAYRRAYGQIAADRRQRLFIVEAGDRLVGCLSLIVVPNLSHQGRPYAMVENVVVDEGARGDGFGQLLMRRAIEEARRAGCYKVALTSNKQRADAHRFYQRLGFQATHEGFRLDLE